MSFSVKSMKTDGNADEQYLDQVSTKASTRTNEYQRDTQQPKITRQTATHATAAWATSFNQISGSTDSVPSPIDARHDELHLKLAVLKR